MQTADAALQAGIDANTADITTLQTDVGTLQTDVGTLRTDVGLQTDVGTLQTDVGALQTSDAAQDAAIAQNTTDIGTLQTDVGGTLQTDVGALQTNDAAQDATIAGILPTSEHFRPISAHERTLVHFDDDCHLQADVAAFSGDVAAIEARLDGTSSFRDSSTASANAVAIGIGQTTGSAARWRSAIRTWRMAPARLRSVRTTRRTAMARSLWAT